MIEILVPNPNAADGRVIGDAAFAGGIVYVDAVNGNDSTAQAGSGALPFRTLTAAKNAAQSGSTIWVRPGTYGDQNLLKNGVNWYFMAGAKVIVTVSNGSYDFIFADDASTPITSVINGFGEFSIQTNITYQAIVSVEHPDSRIYLSCQSMTVSPGAGSYLVYADNNSRGNVIQAKYGFTTASGSNARPRLYAGGTTFIMFDKVLSSNSIYFVVDGGTLSVNYVEDGSVDSTPASILFSAGTTGGGVMNLGVVNCRYDLTLQCNSGNATFNLGTISTGNNCFFNFINATNYLNATRIACGATFTCQSTGGAAEDYIAIEQVTGVNVRFSLSASKAVHYKIGRAWGSAIASVRVTQSPIMSIFECGDMRAPGGSNIDTGAAPFGMIYVANNSNVKNALIGGQFRLTGTDSDQYPLTIMGSNNAIKLKSGTTLVAGSGVTSSSYAEAAQTIAVQGQLITNKAMDSDVTELYGDVIVDSSVA